MMSRDTGARTLQGVKSVHSMLNRGSCSWRDLGLQRLFSRLKTPAGWLLRLRPASEDRARLHNTLFCPLVTSPDT